MFDPSRAHSFGLVEDGGGDARGGCEGGGPPRSSASARHRRL